MPSSARVKRPPSDDRLDLAFHALSDRTRRALLARLVEGPANVSELAAPFAMSRIAVSKHVKVLERAGLIARDVEGRVHRCSLAPGALDDVATWLAATRDFWTATLGGLAVYVESGAMDKPPRRRRAR
jgi:DNA-binding transcriptional ArsR family regulator